MENHREAIEKYELVLKYHDDQDSQEQEEKKVNIPLKDQGQLMTVKERILYNLANCYFHIEEIDQSQKYFEQCLEMNDKSVDCLLGLAKIYQKKQQYKKAIELYDEANKLLPEDQE